MVHKPRKSALRYALAFTGNHIPDWALGSISALRGLNGPVDIVWIQLENTQGQLKATGIKRVRISPSGLQPMEVIDPDAARNNSVIEQVFSLGLDFILCLSPGAFGKEWQDCAKEGI